MTLPFREWNRFYQATLEADGAQPYNAPSKWTTTHWYTCRVGWDYIRQTPERKIKHHAIFRGRLDDKFKLMTSMDQACRAETDVTIFRIAEVADPPIDHSDLYPWILDDPADPSKVWDKDKASGRFYDGVNQWDTHPPNSAHSSNIDEITHALLPLSMTSVFGVENEAGKLVPVYQDSLFKNGFYFAVENMDPGLEVGEKIYYGMTPTSIRVQYFNAVVSDMSTWWCDVDGVELILYGLGFNQSNAEINDQGWSSDNWKSWVWYIDFIGLMGQGTFTLTEAAPANDFIINSDTKITIPKAKLAALGLTPGSYKIRLRKGAAAYSATSYAGDFRCDDEGRCYEAKQFTFYIGPYVEAADFRAEEQPLPLSIWTFADKLGNELTKHFSVVDIRAPSAFYEGLITQMGGLTRAIDDFTGMFSVSDLTLTLDNSDMGFSKILADYPIWRNQPVEVHLAFPGRPEGWKMSLAKLYIHDYTLKGPKIEVSLKDVTQKFFSSKVPKDICTEEEFEHIHESAIGKPMPEILGLCTNTTGEMKGAIEAVYVDTGSYKYLASRGILHDITHVYSDGVLKTKGTDWVIAYDNGHTFIDFVSNQLENKITFNAEGYMQPGWNSSNGYIQNPAYILAYFLAFIAEVPLERMNLKTFEDLATLFEDMGEETAGKFILEDEMDVDAAMQGLPFSFGTKTFPALDGRIRGERMDITNYASNLVVFSQIDLAGPAIRSMNLPQAVNFARVEWDYFPTARWSLGAKEVKHQRSIDDLGARLEPRQRWVFSWTTSESLVDRRVQEELYRRAYGNKKIEFDLPLQWIPMLDLHTTFKFQDPWGISTSKTGERARYYYIESLSYNFSNGRIKVVAVDLQYMLRQYIIAGDEEDGIATNWSVATESDRMFAYACDEATSKFADGEDGKIAGPE